MMAGSSEGEARGSLKVGQVVQICSGRHEFGGLYPVKELSNKRRIYLAELDGCFATVLIANAGGGVVVEVETESHGRAGRARVPAEVLKPMKAKPPKAGV